MRALVISALALALTSPSTATRAPAWLLTSNPTCLLSRTYRDGTVLTVRRQVKGALLTVSRPGWKKRLPRGEAVDVILHFGGGGFGHPREFTANKLRSEGGKVSLTFVLDEDDLLTFRVMSGVKVMRDGAIDLTDWMELDGSATAYFKLTQCRSR